MIHRRNWTGPIVLAAGAALLALGCGGGTGSTDRPAGAKGHGHPHADEGPHHGALVEWGDSYHAELVADRDRGAVTVYVLGKDAKALTPITAEKLLLATTDPALQVELAPLPEPNDPPGRASRFTGTLPEAARGRRLTGTLGAVVDGKRYSGDFREVQPHKD